MNLLFIGDVVGGVGSHYVEKVLPALKREFAIDVTVINGENSAQGNGITRHSSDNGKPCLPPP